MNIDKNHTLCLGCLEYVCPHNYPELDINDTRSVCLEAYTKDNVVYLPNCYHKCCNTCIHVIQSIEETKFENAFNETLSRNYDEINILQNTLLFLRNYNRERAEQLEGRINVIKNQHLEEKLLRGLQNEVTCVICKKIYTSLNDFIYYF
jgi:hypothetical protein